MPTENRSSSTENAPCPFCGGQVDPEGWLRGDGARGPECESCGATAPNLALWNGAQPAQQHLAEPVPDFENCIDARAYIAELFRQRLRRCDFDQYIAERLAGDFAFALANWLVTEGQQAHQHQGEPVEMCVMQRAAGAIADTTRKLLDQLEEVKRLRAALKFYADREHYHFESGNWDTVSSEPLNILWCGEEPDFIEDGTIARNALSASAEPSVPVERNPDVVRQQHYDEFMQRREARAALAPKQ